MDNQYRMLKETKTDITKCPLCEKRTYISNDDYACYDPECKFSIGNNAYFKKKQNKFLQHIKED